MNNEDKIILIIENQWVEFERIAKCLSYNKKDRNEYKYNYKVLMSGIDNDFYDGEKTRKENEINDMQRKFISFIDKIRIFVNDEYNKTDDEYSAEAFKEIKKMAEKADIVIMDYILGGAFGSKTGVDLAFELMKGKEINNIKPVLFLSKTENTDKNIKDSFDGYKSFISGKINKGRKNIDIDKYTLWKFKGFFGDEILNDEYIKNEVIKNGIEELLKEKLASNEIKDKISDIPE